MAENTEVVSPEQQQADLKAQLDQQMGLALGTLKPADTQQQQADNQQASPAATTTTDRFNVFTERFGYDTPEKAIQEIEELRAYKATPVVPEIKFENEASEKAFKALTAGKMQEVYAILEQDVKIDKILSAAVTNETAADVIKLGMQLKYKDLTSEEINYKFNKQFALPAKPTMLPSEEQEEYDQRLAAWQDQVKDKQTELLIEAKLARPDLQAAKQKLVFPEIEQQQDQGYAQYQKMLADGEKAAAVAAAEYQKLTPELIEKKVAFNDEKNKIAFEFQYKPTQEAFGKAVEATIDESKFWKLFDGPDGKPDRAKFLRVINYALDEDGVLMSAMNQSKNATIKAALPNNTQNGGLVRQLITEPGEESELDKQMRLSGVARKTV